MCIVRGKACVVAQRRRVARKERERRETGTTLGAVGFRGGGGRSGPPRLCLGGLERTSRGGVCQQSLKAVRGPYKYRVRLEPRAGGAKNSPVAVE